VILPRFGGHLIAGGILVGNALAYHLAYEFRGDVTALPGGQAWLDAVNQAPERERHLAVHDLCVPKTSSLSVTCT
jgi:hypothetical protein